MEANACGTAIAAITIATPITNISSISVYPQALSSRHRSVQQRAPATALLRRVLSTRGRHGDVRLQLQKALLADALDVHQLLVLLEAAVLLPVFDDALGCRFADPRERVELRCGGGVQIDRRSG